MKTSGRTTNILSGSGLVLLGSFMLGWVFPDSFWGTHYLAFLPMPVAVVLVVLAAGLVLSPYLIRRGIGLPSLPALPLNRISILVLTLLCGGLFYLAPIADDNYGDAAEIQPLLEERVTQLPDGYWGAVFSIRFESMQSKNGVLQVVDLMSYTLGVDRYQAFRLLDAVCGALLILIWLSFIRWYVPDESARMLLVLAALGSPFLIVFFGHVEFYGLGLLILTGWLSLLFRFLEDFKSLRLVGLVLLLVVGLHFHPFFVLLVPGLLLAVLAFLIRPGMGSGDGENAAGVREETGKGSAGFGSRVGERANPGKRRGTQQSGIGSESQPQDQLLPPFFGRLLTLRGMGLFVLLPLVILGLVAYFFIFEDHVNTRVAEGNALDRLFLPLVSPDPPLDKYNLFSLNHLFDFLNVLLFLSPVTLFLLLNLRIRLHRGWGFWRFNPTSQPAQFRARTSLVILALTILLFEGLLFFINPLVSMPMDFDLFCFLGPQVLFLAAMMFRISLLTESPSPIRSPHRKDSAFSGATHQGDASDKPHNEKSAGVPPKGNRKSPPTQNTPIQPVSTSTTNQHTSQTRPGSKPPNSPFQAFLRQLMLPASGLSLLLIPVVLVNHSRDAHSYRLESVAIHIYKTYYQHSDRFLLYALQRIPGDPDLYLRRKDQAIAKLRPHAIPGKDKKLHNLLMDSYFTANQFKKPPATIIGYLAEADQYQPLPNEQRFALLQLYFQQGQFKQAYAEAARLIPQNYPTPDKALLTGIHTALEAQRYQNALTHARAYLQLHPEDVLMQTIVDRLAKQDRVGELKRYFGKQ